MTLIPRTKAKAMFSEPGKVMDDRTFETVVSQYGLKKYPVGKRVKFDLDQIKRKLERV